MPFARQIPTARLLLREPRPTDASMLWADALGSPEVLRHVGIQPFTSEAQTRQHLNYAVHRWMKHSGWLWIVALRAEGATGDQAIGQVELTPMSQPAIDTHHLRLGYVLARPHWGRGYMSEAVQSVLAAAWQRPPVWRVDALCDVDNLASQALLSRVGMVREGRLSRAVMHPNVSAQPRDAWLYAACRPDTPT